MNWVYFDVETERSADEVGGWSNIEKLGVACVVTCASRDDNDGEPVFKTFRREALNALFAELQSADCLVGFNSRGFDVRVLQPFAEFDLRALPHLDLMLELKAVAGFRPNLNSCCAATLGESKSSNGLESLQWWRDGEQQKVIDYCRDDVSLTRRLHEFGARNGHVKCLDKSGQTRVLPVNWKLDVLPHNASSGAQKVSSQGTLF